MAITNINTLDLGKSYTYADYLKWHFDERVELIKGRIFKMSPSPLSIHQRISFDLGYRMNNFLETRPCEVFDAPFDVRLPKKEKTDGKTHTVVQPDICVICDSSKLDKNGCIGAPDLIVEILSPSTAKKDLNDKYCLYQEHGVKEYWIVSPEKKYLDIFVLDAADKYQKQGTFRKGDIASSKVIEGLTIDMNKVFRDKLF